MLFVYKMCLWNTNALVATESNSLSKADNKQGNYNMAMIIQ